MNEKSKSFKILQKKRGEKRMSHVKGKYVEIKHM